MEELNAKVRAVETTLNYHFWDKSLLLQALEAAGASTHWEGNKRLALVGDAAMRLSLSEIGFEGGRTTGKITISHDAWANNANLARVGYLLGLDVHVQLASSVDSSVPQRLMATTVEALIGAVYYDCGKDTGTIRTLLHRLGFVPSYS